MSGVPGYVVAVPWPGSRTGMGGSCASDFARGSVVTRVVLMGQLSRWMSDAGIVVEDLTEDRVQGFFDAGRAGRQNRVGGGGRGGGGGGEERGRGRGRGGGGEEGRGRGRGRRGGGRGGGAREGGVGRNLKRGSKRKGTDGEDAVPLFGTCGAGYRPAPAGGCSDSPGGLLSRYRRFCEGSAGWRRRRWSARG